MILFWFRRDLRIEDNMALYYALTQQQQVLPLFIFDTHILSQLSQDDSRVTFIYKTLQQLKRRIIQQGSDILILYGKPEEIIPKVIIEYSIRSIYSNIDFEPYSIQRDEQIKSFCLSAGVAFNTYVDHLLMPPDAILKADGAPYTVFTPYMRTFRLHLQNSIIRYPSEQHLQALVKQTATPLLDLSMMGFRFSSILVTEFHWDDRRLQTYQALRDIPSVEGTSRAGAHLRFGTISIRALFAFALQHSEVYVNELIWREFYQMLLYHFPYSATSNFKRKYDALVWRNNEADFIIWCRGETGYPMVDAGMRQLNETGWMHNRLRMITASFLTKHLLIDWRWGEAYFASRLVDYELASNVGGWQWAASTGSDAVPYFRVFNPMQQQKKFDADLHYIKTWIKDYDTYVKKIKPMVEHAYARERALNFYKGV